MNNIKSFFTKAKPYIIWIGVTAVGAALSSFFSKDSSTVYGSLTMPPLSPPSIVFPIVWTILYLLMAIAASRIYASGGDKKAVFDALFVYCLQLAVNLIWPFLFFVMQKYLSAFFWLVLLILLVVITICRFAKLDKPASYLLYPYLLWCVFAAYLNLGIVILNK